MGLPAISAGLGTAGAAIGAFGQIRSGEANAAEASYRAQVAANNAISARQNAAYATQAGETQTYDIGLREKARAASVRTAFAANNIDVNSGSAARVQASQAELGQMAEERTMANAALQAYGYRTQATSFEAQERLAKAEAPQDRTAGFLGGAGTLLAGASEIGFKWNPLVNNPGF